MFQGFKLGTKLMLSFALVALLSVVVGAIGLYNLSQMKDLSHTTYERDVLGISATKEAKIDLLYIGRAARNAILATSPEQKSAALNDLGKSQALAKADMAKARALYYSEEGKAAFAAVEAAWPEYEKRLAELTANIARDPLGQQEAAVTLLFGGFKDQVNLLDGLMATATKIKEVNAAKAEQANAERFVAVSGLVIGSVVAALVLGLALGAGLTRSVTRQLGGEPADAVTVANAIAEGNLAFHIQTRAGDNASIMAAMSRMREHLARLVSQVRASSDSIATGSAQIATGNADLSQRTEEQASNLQQTAASMEQLSGTVKTSADTAGHANELAASASAAAVKGGEVVGQVVATMQEIATSSKRISDIIGVIDGIAFQTNILALNAAVEAARAGEQGRGFAVVASEVRSLAGRSAEAAREIKSLIGASVEKVEVGARQVDEAGSSMTEIVSQVQRVSQLISEISSAAVEQSTGIGQVGQAVQQLDQVTQQNAALVEESAAAAESLKHQAAQLSDVVSVFRV